MKFRHTILLTIIVIAHAGVACAQHPLDSLFATIEANNPRLLALRKSNIASIAEKKSENTLGETSVEYTPFFQRGTNGIASSELIVSQEFDFPTLYASRRKAASLQQNVLEQEYLLLRRDILLEASRLCNDLITSRQIATFLERRLSYADSLLSICNRRMAHGDATIMELNRVKMDRMTILTEQAQNQGDVQRTRASLTSLGASEPQLDELLSAFSFSQFNTSSTIPSLVNVGAADVDVAQANLLSAQQEVRLTMQSWIPKFTIGYRRNTELREHFNGPLVGISVPLFSNSKKVKAARLRQSASEQQLESARIEVENRRRALYTEATSLRTLIEAYDLPLLDKTLSDLMRAVTAGELSIMEYYTEAERVHTTHQAYLQAVNNYCKVVTELNMY